MKKQILLIALPIALLLLQLSTKTINAFDYNSKNDKVFDSLDEAKDYNCDGYYREPFLLWTQRCMGLKKSLDRDGNLIKCVVGTTDLPIHLLDVALDPNLCEKAKPPTPSPTEQPEAPPAEASPAQTSIQCPAYKYNEAESICYSTSPNTCSLDQPADCMTCQFANPTTECPDRHCCFNSISEKYLQMKYKVENGKLILSWQRFPAADYYSIHIGIPKGYNPNSAKEPSLAEQIKSFIFQKVFAARSFDKDTTYTSITIDSLDPGLVYHVQLFAMKKSAPQNIKLLGFSDFNVTIPSNSSSNQPQTNSSCSISDNNNGTYELIGTNLPKSSSFYANLVPPKGGNPADAVTLTRAVEVSDNGTLVLKVASYKTLGVSDNYEYYIVDSKNTSQRVLCAFAPGQAPPSPSPSASPVEKIISDSVAEDYLSEQCGDNKNCKNEMRNQCLNSNLNDLRKGDDFLACIRSVVKKYTTEDTKTTTERVCKENKTPGKSCADYINSCLIGGDIYKACIDSYNESVAAVSSSQPQCSLGTTSGEYPLIIMGKNLKPNINYKFQYQEKEGKIYNTQVEKKLSDSDGTVNFTFIFDSKVNLSDYNFYIVQDKTNGIDCSVSGSVLATDIQMVIIKPSISPAPKPLVSPVLPKTSPAPSVKPPQKTKPTVEISINGNRDEDKFVFSPQEEVNIAARLLTDSDNPNDPNNGCIPTAKGITFFLSGTKVGTALACQTIRYKLPKEPNKYKILAQFDGDDQTGLIAASRETTITLSNKSTVPTEMLAHINGNHDAQVYANATYVNLGARFFVKGNSPDACIPTTISLKFWKVAGNKEENIPIDLHGDKASANCQSYKALLKGPGTYFFEAKYEENNKTVFLNASDTVKLVVAEIPQKSTITTFTIKPQPTNKQSRSGAGPQKAVAGISTTVLKPMLLAQATENKVIITISPCTVPSNDPNNNSAIDENVNVNIQDLESGKTFKGVFPNCQDSTIELDGFSPNDHLAGNACLPQNDSLEYEGSCSADAVVQVSTGNQTTPSITPEQESNNELHIQPENPGPYDNVTVTAYTSEIVSSPVFTITNNERTFQIQPEANDTNLSCQDKIGECTYSVNIPSPAGSYHISFKLDSGKEATFDFSTREEQDSQQETQATPTPENAVPTQEEQLTEEVAPTPIPQLTAATLFDIETGEEIPIPISGVLPLHLGGSPSENHEYKFLVKKYYSDNTTEEEPLVIQYEPKAEPACVQDKFIGCGGCGIDRYACSDDSNVKEIVNPEGDCAKPQYNNACEQEPQQPEESPVSIDEEPTPTEEPQPILCIYEEYPRNCPNGGTRKCKGSNEGEGCHYNPEINPDCEEECNQETEPTTPQTNDKYSWYCNESVIIEKTPTGEENVFQDCADIEQQCEEFYNYDYGADDAMCVTP